MTCHRLVTAETAGLNLGSSIISNLVFVPVHRTDVRIEVTTITIPREFTALIVVKREANRRPLSRGRVIQYKTVSVVDERLRNISEMGTVVKNHSFGTSLSGHISVTRLPTGNDIEEFDSHRDGLETGASTETTRVARGHLLAEPLILIGNEPSAAIVLTLVQGATGAPTTERALKKYCDKFN